MRTPFELAEAVKLFAPALFKSGKLSFRQQKTLNKIALCRTAALGGHEEVCDNCGVLRYSYNSCRDRHCPKCQAAKQAFWIDDLVRKTLPVKHFHIVFTVPHQLNVVCLFDSRMFYDLLFQALWQTLRSFGYSHYGCETGVIAVLHTWGQNLSLHPHVHCIVPAAGYTLDGNWKNIGKDGKFLYPVHQLSATFKGKLLDSLKRALKKSNRLMYFKDLLQKSYNTKWVVHCEPSLANADHVVRYLGQYTHRVAITNQRILSIANGKVTFIAKDYANRGIKKPVTLNGEEFIRRFSQHILPDRFVKIRYYGIYNHTVKNSLKPYFTAEDKTVDKKDIQTPKSKESTLERFERITGINPCSCEVCKSGKMIIIRKLPRIRSPDQNLSEQAVNIL